MSHPSPPIPPQAREDEGLPVADLLHLVAQVVPYHMTHNAEPEAVDLLLEVSHDS